MRLFLSFGEGLGVRLFSLFWRGAGGEAVCFIWFMFIIASSQAHRAIRVDLRYLCSLIIKQQSRVRLLIRLLRVQSVCAILKQQGPQGYSFDLRYSCSFKRSSSRAELGSSSVSLVQSVCAILQQHSPQGYSLSFA